MKKFKFKLSSLFIAFTMFLNSCDAEAILNQLANTNLDMDFNDIKVEEYLPTTQSQKESCNHNYTAWSGTHADCDCDGYLTRYCTLCGKVEFQNEQAHGHSISDSYTTDDNYHYYECKECGQHFESGVHQFAQTSILAEADEYNEGLALYTCSVCKKTITKKIPKLTHKHEMEYHAATVTCDKDGLVEYYYCSKCQNYYSDEKGYNQIYTTYSEPLGHLFDSYSFNDNILSSSGYCSRCNQYVESQCSVSVNDKLRNVYQYVRNNGVYGYLKFTAVSSGNYIIKYPGECESLVYIYSLAGREDYLMSASYGSRMYTITAGRTYYLAINPVKSFEVTIDKEKENGHISLYDYGCKCGSELYIDENSNPRNAWINGSCWFTCDYSNQLKTDVYTCGNCGFKYADINEYYSINCKNYCKHRIVALKGSENNYEQYELFYEEYATGWDSHNYYTTNWESTNTTKVVNNNTYNASINSYEERCYNCDYKRKIEDITLYDSNGNRAGNASNRSVYNNDTKMYDLEYSHIDLFETIVVNGVSTNRQIYSLDKQYDGTTLTNNMESFYTYNKDSCSCSVTYNDYLNNNKWTNTEYRHGIEYSCLEFVNGNCDNGIERVCYCSVCGQETNRWTLAYGHYPAYYFKQNGYQVFDCYYGCPCCDNGSIKYSYTFNSDPYFSYSLGNVNSKGIYCNVDDQRTLRINVKVIASGFYSFSSTSNNNYAMGQVMISDSSSTFSKTIDMRLGSDYMYLDSSKNYYVSISDWSNNTNVNINLSPANPDEIIDLSDYEQNAKLYVKGNSIYLASDYIISGDITKTQTTSSGLRIVRSDRYETVGCYQYSYSDYTISNDNLNLKPMTYTNYNGVTSTNHVTQYNNNSNNSTETIDDVTYSVFTSTSENTCSNCGDTTYRSIDKTYSLNNLTSFVIREIWQFDSTTNQLYLYRINNTYYQMINGFDDNKYNKVVKEEEVYYNNKGTVSSGYKNIYDYKYGDSCHYDLYQYDSWGNLNSSNTYCENHCDLSTTYQLHEGATSCSEGVDRITKCKGCGTITNNREYYSYTHRDKVYEYVLHDGATSCDQGLDYVYHCKTCGYEFSRNQYQSYNHDYQVKSSLNGSSIELDYQCSHCDSSKHYNINYNVLDGITINNVSSDNWYTNVYLYSNIDRSVELYFDSSVSVDYHLVNDNTGSTYYKSGSSVYSIIFEMKSNCSYRLNIYTNNNINDLSFNIIENNNIEVIDFKDYGCSCGTKAYFKGSNLSSYVDFNLDNHCSNNYDYNNNYYYCSKCDVKYSYSDTYYEVNCENYRKYILNVYDKDNNKYSFEKSFSLGSFNHYSIEYIESTENEYNVYLDVVGDYCNLKKTVSYDICKNCSKALNKHERFNYTYLDGKEAYSFNKSYNCVDGDKNNLILYNSSATTKLNAKDVYFKFYQYNSNGDITMFSSSSTVYSDSCHYTQTSYDIEGNITSQYNYTNHDNVCVDYPLHDGSKTCTDGIDRVEYCKTCGEELNRREYYSYSHISDTWEYVLHEGSTLCTDGLDYVHHCKSCGYEYSRDENSSHNHNYVYSCSNDGDNYTCNYKCSICDNEKTQNIKVNNESDVIICKNSFDSSWFYLEFYSNENITVEINVPVSNIDFYVVDQSSWKYTYRNNFGDNSYSVIVDLKKSNLYKFQSYISNYKYDFEINFVNGSSVESYDLKDYGCECGSIAEFKTSNIYGGTIYNMDNHCSGHWDNDGYFVCETCGFKYKETYSNYNKGCEYWNNLLISFEDKDGNKSTITKDYFTGQINHASLQSQDYISENKTDIYFEELDAYCNYEHSSYVHYCNSCKKYYNKNEYERYTNPTNGDYYQISKIYYYVDGNKDNIYLYRIIIDKYWNNRDFYSKYIAYDEKGNVISFSSYSNEYTDDCHYMYTRYDIDGKVIDSYLNTCHDNVYYEYEVEGDNTCSNGGIHRIAHCIKCGEAIDYGYYCQHIYRGSYNVSESDSSHQIITQQCLTCEESQTFTINYCIDNNFSFVEFEEYDNTNAYKFKANTDLDAMYVNINANSCFDIMILDSSKNIIVTQTNSGYGNNIYNIKENDEFYVVIYLYEIYNNDSYLSFNAFKN